VIFPQLLSIANAVLAVQMPSGVNSPAHQLLDELASSAAFGDTLKNVAKWRSHELPFYYDLLAQHASHLELWSTEYIHVLPKPEAIVEWYKSTGLRPYLDAFDNESERTTFIAEYTEGIRTIYHAQPDGRVLFPFRRIFIIAYK
jgi:trans-aconitate 2-methyltransferase